MSRVEELKDVDGIVLQQKLWGRVEIQGTDRIKINDKSVDVLQEILRINPEIDRISYVKFDPDMPSSHGVTIGESGLFWLPRRKTREDSLRELSDYIFLNDRQYLELGSSETLDFKKAIAIGSAVGVGREKLHIPMMDFVPEPGFDEQDIFRAMDPYKGIVVKTDNSYHFWGFNLLNSSEYEIFLNRSEDEGYIYLKEYELPIVDEGFIKAGRDKGFSALRLFGYPGTFREEEPYVVAISG